MKWLEGRGGKVIKIQIDRLSSNNTPSPTFCKNHYKPGTSWFVARALSTFGRLSHTYCNQSIFRRTDSGDEHYISGTENCYQTVLKGKIPCSCYTVQLTVNIIEDILYVVRGVSYTFSPSTCHDSLEWIHRMLVCSLSFLLQAWKQPKATITPCRNQAREMPSVDKSVLSWCSSSSGAPGSYHHPVH